MCKPHPIEKIHHITAIRGLSLSGHPQRQGDIVIGREMVKEAEFLKHDADPPPDWWQLVML